MAFFAGRPNSVSPVSLTSAGRGLCRHRSDTRRCACGRPRDGLAEAAVDLVLQRMRSTKHEDAPRADRHLLACLRVAPDSPAFLADRKASEGRDLDHLATFERTGYLSDHRLDEFCRLVTRQAELLINRFGELSAGNRLSGHDALPAFWRLDPPKNFVKLQSVAQNFPSQLLPANHTGAPSQTTPQRFHQHQIAGPDAAIGYRFVER